MYEGLSKRIAELRKLAADIELSIQLGKREELSKESALAVLRPVIETCDEAYSALTGRDAMR